MNFCEDYLCKICHHIKKIDISLLDQTCDVLKSLSKRGKKLIIVGNGGSAAIASHVTVDLIKNTGIRAINFNEADLITCLANDYGYEHWVEIALKLYADRGDVLVLISSSGCSLNILNAAVKAKEMDLQIVTLTGFLPDNPLRKTGDINFWVDSTNYNFVEMTHHIWLLAIIDKLIADSTAK